ncbi:MAG: CoA transferase, partial [Proteobacteria bacterium]|nr:CoA transferase [Pseudomonadota bacterium]
AEVVKIEPPDGDPWRVMGAGFAGVNRGKRSLVVDLKKEAGKRIAHELIARSDILVENARWGVLHRLGMDYETVEKINPDIIYLSILSYGPTGPLSDLPGYDPLLQARSGQSVAQGGLGKPPVFHLVAINDMAAPMLGAYGVALGLLARKKTGKGQNVRTSLANAAAAMQAHQFIDYDGVDYQDLGDTDLLGINATHRHYKTLDGRWLFILCPNEGHWQHLCGELGLADLPADPRFRTRDSRLKNDEALVEILAGSFKSKTLAEWMAILPQADIPVATGNDYPESPKEAHLQENSIFDERDHPEFGRVMQVGLMPRFSEISGVIQRHAPLFGEHTEEVLSELGYTDTQISNFVNERVAYPTPEGGTEHL